MPKTEQEILEEYKKAISAYAQYLTRLAKAFNDSMIQFAKMVEKIGEIDARPGRDSVRDPETVAEDQAAELHEEAMGIPASSHLRDMV